MLINTLRGNARAARLGGREYLVAPLVLAAPGVRNPKYGRPTLHLPGEIVRSAPAWDGISLTLGHLVRNDGRPADVSDPLAIARQRIGFVDKPHATPGAELRAEGWFDVRLTRRLSPRLLAMLERGERVGVSCGYGCDFRPVPPGARHGGRGYERIALNYRPAHVAVLLDAPPACPVARTNARDPDDLLPVLTMFDL